ncbi:hypothetical protein K8I31_06120, partial [bacterium]|nr:hypothetical protein [bacterium]
FLSYAKPDGLEMTNEFEGLQYSQSFSLDVISVYLNSKDKSVVIGIVANRFNEPPFQKMIVDHWDISKEESIMKPNFFFAPSNGLASRGSLYLDIFGNHSPWIHKPKTDLIASELKQQFNQSDSHE